MPTDPMGLVESESRKSIGRPVPTGTDSVEPVAALDIADACDKLAWTGVEDTGSGARARLMA